MQTVKDVAGVDYRLELTVGACYEIRSEAGLDLLGITSDPSTLAAIAHEAHRVFDAIWCLVRQQAQERGLAHQLEWLKQFDAEASAALIRAFRAELDFFCRERRGAAYGEQVRRLIETTSAQLDLALEAAMEMDAEMDPEKRKAEIQQTIRENLKRGKN